MAGLTTCCLVLLLGAPQDPADRARALVEQLGNDDIALREQATGELIRIGWPSLAVLREAATKSEGEKKEVLTRIINRVSMLGAPATVTLESADRPLREIAASVEKQTGIPIRLVGAAADAKGSVSAKETVVWKVIEDLCRARGDLMYRFIDDVVEIYPSPFRSLPSVDKHGMRFFIDRFIWDQADHGGKHKHPGFFREHVALLVPRGARVVWVGYKVLERTDDKGNSLVTKPPQHSGFGGPLIPVNPDGFMTQPSSRKFVYPFYIHELNQPPPAADAARIARLRGLIEVVVAEGLQKMASIAHPLERPPTPAGDVMPSLGVSNWKVDGDQILLRIKSAWLGTSERDIWFKVRPLLFLKDKDGNWQTSPPFQAHSRPSSDEVVRLDRIMKWRRTEGDSAVSLELAAPHPLVHYEIPFDFKDLPLR
jgi:hypothetical protein